MKRPRKILFVCIGNSCRSQMAEAFARAYGGDLIAPASAGVYPASIVAPDTVRAMAEKNLSLAGHMPKSIRQVDRSQFDLIIDMSGGELEPGDGPQVRVWDVSDPVSMNYADHCKVRDQIEQLVLDLVRELRNKKPKRMALSW